MPNMNIPDLDTVIEAPSMFENQVGVFIHKDRHGNYRRRPQPEKIFLKVISARNNNSAFMPTVQAVYPRVREDGTDKP